MIDPSLRLQLELQIIANSVTKVEKLVPGSVPLQPIAPVTVSPACISPRPGGRIDAS